MKLNYLIFSQIESKESYKNSLVVQKEIAQLTCECERHIGTQSGGMDQVFFLYFAINRLNMENRAIKGCEKVL